MTASLYSDILIDTGDSNTFDGNAWRDEDLEGNPTESRSDRLYLRRAGATYPFLCLYFVNDLTNSRGVVPFDVLGCGDLFGSFERDTGITRSFVSGQVARARILDDPIGGKIDGQFGAFAVHYCLNKDTGQMVTGAASADDGLDCRESGLDASPGDSVLQYIRSVGAERE